MPHLHRLHPDDERMDEDAQQEQVVAARPTAGWRRAK